MTFTEQNQKATESYIENQASSALSTSSEDSGTIEILVTPFGDIRVDEAKAVTFEKGMPGLEEATEYALAPMPGANLSSFLMLHSLQVPKLTLVTLPLDPNIDLIAKEHLEEAANALGCKFEDALFVLLVSTHFEPTPMVTANIRAPIVIDVNTRKAIQHILTEGDYDTRFRIK
jgi:flagellar assembly factor FliW